MDEFTLSPRVYLRLLPELGFAVRTEIMLFAHDVIETSKWYQSFLDMESGHGGSEFEMLTSGQLSMLQLHHIDPEDHDHGVRIDQTLGAGVVVFVHVDDPEAAAARANELGIEIIEPLAWNELAGMHAFSVRDPNGYTLSICKSTRG